MSFTQNFLGSLRVSLNRSNSSYYYVIAPVGDIYTVVNDAEITTNNLDEMLPRDGSGSMALADLPSSNSVMNFISNNEMIKSGRGVFTDSEVSFTVSGLNPETDYIVYFVLCGESQNSFSPKAYCFRFSTGDVDIPTIQLNANNLSVEINTSTDADGLWVLQQTTLLSNTSPFSYPFIQYIAGYQAGTNGEHVGECADFAKYYPEDMTVLDAMVENVGSENYQSVFDFFAGSSIYEEVRSAIMEYDGSDAWLQTGALTTYKDVPQSVSVDPTMLSVGSQYYFLVSMKNQLASSSTQYAFKAVKPIYISDESHLMG